jgi:hypothetical protein
MMNYARKYAGNDWDAGLLREKTLHDPTMMDEKSHGSVFPISSASEI